uniref:SAP30_Sin3_bdg domain-containing protein n=1 Tax=Globodera pallida TaxID=36090 RepID=A0A183BRE6_GLOPA
MASNSRQHSDNANTTTIVAFEQEAHNMAAAATKFRTPTIITTAEEERSRTRRRMGRPKLYNSSSSKSTSLATLLALLALSSMALPTARSATFFYGATDGSDGDDTMNDADQGQLDGARALAMAESAAAVHHHHAHAHASSSNSDVAEEEEETRLSKHELQAVYKFCEILPQLQQQGFIPENKHARDLCKKLVDMLKPMFRKRTRSSAQQAALPMPSRPRRHVAALLLQQAQQTLTNKQAH